MDNSCVYYIFTYLALWLFRKKKRTYKGILLIYATIIIYIFTVDAIYTRVLKDYQRARIEVLFGKIEDSKGIDYNVIQSKIAIGSGGLLGKGFRNGTQTNLNFVPEQSTDFIFCTIGEEWGFVGSSVVVLLYAWLIIHIFLRSEQQRVPFVRIYGYCIACIFFAHFTINIGMTLGIMPVIGIPYRLSAMAALLACLHANAFYIYQFRRKTNL